MYEPLEKTTSDPPEFEGLSDAEILDQHARQLATMEGLDYDDPKVMAGAWRKVEG